MGATALKSKPTIHDGALNNIYKSQQPSRSISTSSKASYAVSDYTSQHDGPRSPVSPLESSGDTWKYLPRAQTHLEGLGTFHEVPLDETPKDHFGSRPMSYYDGLQTSPEPQTKAVLANLPVASANKRLSRPFEQPYPAYNHGLMSAQRQTSAPPVNIPMQAKMPRADSHLRGEPANPSQRKAVPAPLAIPKPAHQSRRQHQQSPYQEKQPAQGSGHRQGNQARTQRPARHQGWNPFEEPPRQQRTVGADRQDRRHSRRRSEDLERQAGLSHSKHNDPQYKSGRRCFFFLIIMMILVVVIIVVTIRKNMH